MNGKRNTLHLVAAGAIAIAVTALGICGPAQAQTKLKWAHVYETSEPFHRYSVWAADEIKKRSNGKYDIQVFPASSLGKESDINQGLTLGTVDIIISGASFAGVTYKPIAITYFPFIFRDADHQLKFAKSEVFAELAKGYDEKSGNHITALNYYGSRHVTSNAAHPVAKPEDMKGLKIRVPDAPAYLAFPKSLGANATPIAFAEVYLALQSGTVDAQENPLPTIEAKKFYEVQKNISLTGHIVDSLLTIVSGQLWGKLTPDEQKMFTEVMQEAAEKTGREIIASEARLVDEFKKKGLNVISVDKAAFRETVLKNTKPTDHGYRQQDYDRIIAIK
jgi:tripartite ATP-independent transporter DctP family solute receptor